METIRIPNRVTFFPVALSDVFLAAPIASRILFRSAIPGGVLGAAAIGAYAGSAFRDWLARRGVRPIRFERDFGVNSLSPPPMSPKERSRDIGALTERLNSIYQPRRMTRRELARTVDESLTGFIAGITGQRVETSVEVRSFMLQKYMFPFALGGCDVISGEVAVFRDVGIFEPHVLAHEFCHRKGYLREVEAQVLAYLSLSRADAGECVQSALAERLYRQLILVAEHEPDRYREAVEAAGLRAELKAAFLPRCGTPSAYERAVGPILKRAYEARMQITGQNGLSDYDEGFTNLVYAIESGVRHSVADGAGTDLTR